MRRAWVIATALLNLSLLTSSAWATEGGGSTYPHGVDGFMAGALPPPGTYFLNYLTHYTANRINDGQGKNSGLDVKIRAYAESLRFLHITDTKILGGNLGGHIILPIVRLDFESSTLGVNRSRTGLGDLTIDPFILSWHAGNWHWATGLDITLPTGRYDSKERFANIGRNYFSLEPLFVVTYLSDSGFEATGKFMFDYNYKNMDHDYKSGNEFHVDYTISQKFGDFTAGIGGYYYKQVSDDRGALAPANGNRGRAIAAGPQLKYDYQGMSFIGKWQHEFVAENRAQGDKFWLTFIKAL